MGKGYEKMEEETLIANVSGILCYLKLRMK
jgi:hypothetical protein